MSHSVSFARTIFKKLHLTDDSRSTISSDVKIKQLNKQKKRYNPLEEVREREYARLPQLNKFHKLRRINGFGA